MAIAQAEYNKWIAIVPSDTVNMDASVSTVGSSVKPCDAIFVGGAGTVTVVSQDGRTAQFTAAAGAILPLRAIRVNSTGTAGTLLVALYVV